MSVSYIQIWPSGYLLATKHYKSNNSNHMDIKTYESYCSKQYIHPSSIIIGDAHAVSKK